MKYSILLIFSELRALVQRIRNVMRQFITLLKHLTLVRIVVLTIVFIFMSLVASRPTFRVIIKLVKVDIIVIRVLVTIQLKGNIVKLHYHDL